MQWAQAKQQVKHTQVSCTIPSRADLADEHELLCVELVAARAADEEQNRDPVAPAIAQRIRDLEVEIAASAWTFTFRGLARQKYRRLLMMFPPSAEQAERLKELGLVAEYDDEKFPPAVLAASCVRVEIAATKEAVEGVDWAEIWDEWSTGQTTRLWRTCLAANTGVADVPKSAAASAVILASRPS
jgi:hypothetical protein